MGKTQKNEFDISGKVLWVGMPVEIPKTSILKRTVVIEGWVESKYKQEFAFDFVNDNMDKLNNVRVDDWVVIDFHLRGRKNINSEGKARWYTNLEGTTCTVEH
jgi:hypothetical protein